MDNSTKYFYHTLNRELNIKDFHVDFDISVHNTLVNLYPNFTIVVCTFHLIQLVSAYLKYIQLLLEYNIRNSNIGK